MFIGLLSHGFFGGGVGVGWGSCISYAAITDIYPLGKMTSFSHQSNLHLFLNPFTSLPISVIYYLCH